RNGGPGVAGLSVEACRAAIPDGRSGRRGGPITPGISGSAPARPVTGAGETSGDDCLIKGNINRRGDRIYHVPGTHAWEATRIDRTRGERWFCSEEEARAAGWRAPR